jgi:cytochrome c biogenesis protein CcdA
MEFANLVFALLAGLFAVLSPCVLPLLPVVFSVAVAEQAKLGVVALAAGLGLSFLTAGLFVATIGFALGVDSEQLRMVAAILLIVVGGVLVVPLLQTQVTRAAGPISHWAERHVSGWAAGGLAHQFVVGLLLGVVWSPCVGPTLGAASVLAAQGHDLGRVALTLLMFAVGTAFPLLILGLLSRAALMRWHGYLVTTGKVGTSALGLILITTGALILSGFDKSLEAVLVCILPLWFINLITGF